MPKIEITAKDGATGRKRQRQPSVGRWWQYGLLLTVHVLLIVVIALLISTLREETSVKIESQPEPVDVLQAIAMGDQLLVAGKPHEAMETYEKASKATSSPPASLWYRMGVCAEQQGKLDEALGFFSSTAQQDTAEISMAARLGLARVKHQQGESDLSSKTLDKLATTSALPVYASTGFGSEIDYGLALVSSDRALATLPNSIRDHGHIFHPTPPTSIEHLLKMVPPAGNQVAMPRPLGDETYFGLEVHGTARNPATTLVSVGFHNQQLSVLLDLLSAKTSWKVAPSAIATEIVSAKRIDVLLRDKTAAEMLSLVLEPQGLFWTFKDDTVVVDRVENFTEAVRFQRQTRRANSLLQNALAEYPNHALAPYAYLALGNLAVLEGRFDRAITFYEEINERFPSHEVCQTANFNLSKVWLLQKDLDHAVESLYKVVDFRRATDVEPLSYLYLGRIFLEQGDLAKAKKTLSRSLAIAKQEETAATASLTLAAVYLMKGDAGAAEAANSVLMEKREALENPAYLSKAVFLSALTRYRAAIRPSDLRHRERELTSALMRVDPADFFGEFGYLLVADAFAEVGVPTEALRLYRQGLSHPLSPFMRDKLLYRLATEYQKQNNFDQAKGALLELVAGSSSTWAPVASIDLAALLLKNGGWDECIHHCRWALEQGYSEQQNSELLRILGSVYEELGDHKRAGHCFAGFLPAEELKVAGAPR